MKQNGIELNVVHKNLKKGDFHNLLWMAERNDTVQLSVPHLSTNAYFHHTLDLSAYRLTKAKAVRAPYPHPFSPLLVHRCRGKH